MKRQSIALAATTVAMLCIAPIAKAEYRCGQPQLKRVDAIACAKAAQDLNALRQFVWNTRMIHHLYFYDYVRPERNERLVAVAATAPESTSDAAAPTKR